jgi:TonB family protein
MAAAVRDAEGRKMKRIHSGVLALGLAMMAAGVPWGRAQSAPVKGAPNATAPSPDPAVLAVEFVSQLTPVDGENLKDYTTGLQTRAKERWSLPALAKPPLSTPGEVRIVCMVHTDGRVTNMTLEQPSGKAALDHAAWAAITGSAPYDAFPYGISVQQVKVRFTFDYNGGASAPTTPGTKAIPGVKPGPVPR